jgi:hypothetical protein
MARRWMGVALLAGWLGLSAPAQAQFPPTPPGSPEAGYPPPASGPVPPPGYGLPGGDGPMPGYPGPDGGPPPLDSPYAPAECLPPNSFSNVHPERVGLVPQFSLQADYLLWWFHRTQVPALVTAGNITDALPGAIGQPNTVSVIGPGGVGPTQQSGGRLSALYWFDQAHTWGVEANAFVMADATSHYSAAGSGDPAGNTVLTRPFFNPNTQMPDADPIAVPGVQSGGLTVTVPRQQVLGADANVRWSQCLDWAFFSRMTVLAGVRYLDLKEKLLIAENTADVLDVFGNPGNSTSLQDSFETSNRFYGGQVGLELESRVGQATLTLLGKVAGGPTRQVINVSGGTILTEPDGTVIVDPTRGLLVQPTNIGHFSRNQFTYVPELDITLAWEFNEHLRVSLGYNILYWSKVVRPGDQIDPIVNIGALNDPGQLGTSPNPIMPFHSTGFWAQGLRAGVQVSF